MLKIVVGASILLPSGLSGRYGCSASTTKPKTNITVLNSSRATAYCFQFCGPVSSGRSSQRSQRGGAVAAVHDPGQVAADRDRQGDGHADERGWEESTCMDDPSSSVRDAPLGRSERRSR